MWNKMGKVEQFFVICVVFGLLYIAGKITELSNRTENAPIVEAHAKANPALAEKKVAVTEKKTTVKPKPKQSVAQKSSGRWQKVMNTPVGGLYIDYLATRYIGDFIETTTMINFGADKGIKVGETPLVSVVNIHRWDCDHQRMQLYKMTAYGRSMAQGEPVHVFEQLGEFVPADLPVKGEGNLYTIACLLKG